jgi:hypothetical protein
MVNAWMTHVKSVSAANKGKSLKEILKMASKTYKKSPATAAVKKHKKHKKRHSTKRKHKKRKGRKHKGRKKQSGGEHDIATDAGAAAPATTEGGNAGSIFDGAACTLPARSGSGSVTQADLNACGSSPSGCNVFKGGKRKRKSKRKKSRRKKRKTRRKSRKRKRR